MITLKPVEIVPCVIECSHRNGKLQTLLTEFMDSDAKIVKIEHSQGEYKSADSLWSTMYGAVKRSGYAISVHKRNGTVYLEKKI